MPELNTQNNHVGKKDDLKKLDFSLLPLDALENVIKVLEFGATKYGRDNWRHLENAKERYHAAMLRHLSAIQAGEQFDKESGLPHSAHMACNAIFYNYFNNRL